MLYTTNCSMQRRQGGARGASCSRSVVEASSLLGLVGAAHGGGEGCRSALPRRLHQRRAPGRAAGQRGGGGGRGRRRPPLPQGPPGAARLYHYRAASSAKHQLEIGPGEFACCCTSTASQATLAFELAGGRGAQGPLFSTGLIRGLRTRLWKLWRGRMLGLVFEVLKSGGTLSPTKGAGGLLAALPANTIAAGPCAARRRRVEAARRGGGGCLRARAVLERERCCCCFCCCGMPLQRRGRPALRPPLCERGARGRARGRAAGVRCVQSLACLETACTIIPVPDAVTCLQCLCRLVPETLLAVWLECIARR